jgi:hypothetical protein
MMPGLVVLLALTFIAATVGIAGSFVFAGDAARFQRRLRAREIELGALRELAAKQRREQHGLRKELIAVKTELFRVKWGSDATTPDGLNARDGGSDGGA